MGALLLAAGSAALHPLESAAEASPTASASPTTGLVDGQKGIAIRGSGFPPYREIQIEECQGTPANPPPDNTSCEGGTLDTRVHTDANGTFDDAPSAMQPNAGYRVYSLPSHVLGLTTSITCDSNDPCSLYVGVDQNDFSQPHAFIGLSFAVAAAPTATPPQPPVSTGGPATPPASTAPVPPTSGALSPAAALPSAGGTGPSRGASADPTVTVGLLPDTGGPAHLVPVAALALCAVAVADIGRRRALRGPRPSRCGGTWNA